MIDILYDSLTLTCLYLIDITVKFENNETFLLSQLTYVSPWRISQKTILYDTENNKRFKVELPLLFRRQGQEAVFDTSECPLKVIEIYLL